MTALLSRRGEDGLLETAAPAFDAEMFEFSYPPSSERCT